MNVNDSAVECNVAPPKFKDLLMDRLEKREDGQIYPKEDYGEHGLGDCTRHIEFRQYFSDFDKFLEYYEREIAGCNYMLVEFGLTGNLLYNKNGVAMCADINMLAVYKYIGCLIEESATHEYRV